MLTLSCQHQSLVHALIASVEKIFDVYQGNNTGSEIQIAVGKSRRDMCIQNNICAAIGEIPCYPIPCSLHHIQKMTFLAISLRSNHMELWRRKSMIIS